MNATILTLNCSKEQQPLDEFCNLVQQVLPQSPPQFLAVGLQEVAPIIASSFGHIGAYTKPIHKAIETALHVKYPTSAFRLSGQHWLGALGLIVYTTEEVSSVEAASTSFGHLWSSLKGAVGLRLHIGDTAVTFVTCHLAANAGYVTARNENYTILANGLVFGKAGARVGLFPGLPNYPVFIFGDLNYRTQKKSADDLETSTDPLISQKILDTDELNIERDSGRTLWGLHEAPVHFKPTFKFYPNTSHYNRKRDPSWCDRILYSDSNAEVSVYDAVWNYELSDHKPVYAQVTVPRHSPAVMVDIPTADYCQPLVSRAADTFVGSVLYLGTTRPGWAVLAILVVLSIWAIY